MKIAVNALRSHPRPIRLPVWHRQAESPQNFGQCGQKRLASLVQPEFRFLQKRASSILPQTLRIFMRKAGKDDHGNARGSAHLS